MLIIKCVFLIQIYFYLELLNYTDKIVLVNTVNVHSGVTKFESMVGIIRNIIIKLELYQSLMHYFDDYVRSFPFSIHHP